MARDPTSAPEHEGRSVDVRETVVCSRFSGEHLHLRWTVGGQPICPVCGLVWTRAREHAWADEGDVNGDGLLLVQPTYDICPCCGTEFGNDDIGGPSDSVQGCWTLLRIRWLSRVQWQPSAIMQVTDGLGL